MVPGLWRTATVVSVTGLDERQRVSLRLIDAIREGVDAGDEVG